MFLKCTSKLHPEIQEISIEKSNFQNGTLPVSTSDPLAAEISLQYRALGPQMARESKKSRGLEKTYLRLF